MKLGVRLMVVASAASEHMGEWAAQAVRGRMQVFMDRMCCDELAKKCANAVHG